MCGIMGYVGLADAVPIVIEGLSRLEYRGYDSAGIAVFVSAGNLNITKTPGKIDRLREALAASGETGHSAIGHTRWATHGKANEVNAHPHCDEAGDVAVIHNGIVENHAELRRRLTAAGHVFISETDTEVIPHLIAEALKDGLDLRTAVQRAIGQIKGAAAIVAMLRQEPGVLVAARVSNAGGVVIGFGDGEMFVASDLSAILPHTGQVAFLDDGEVARLTAGGATFFSGDGTAIEKMPVVLEVGAIATGKGQFRHFMAKEIAEQPDAVLDTIRGSVDLENHAIDFPDIDFADERWLTFQRVVLVGMGTSSHAAQIGRSYIERIAGLPAEADNASEYRYRSAVIDATVLMIAVLQSGETVDTLAAMHEAKSHGATVIAVCNTPGSQATRVADGTILIHCGPEVAVASTKTFLGSVSALYLLACELGRIRGRLDPEQFAKAIDDLALVPGLIGEVLKTEPECQRIAARFAASDHFLFLGRGLQYPIAMEGALKLKEVSYVHAEGYAAGEMKHGPIALIDERMPVVAIAVHDEGLAKMMSNIEEVKARGGTVVVIATEGEEHVAGAGVEVIYVPEVAPLLAPLITAVPVQLLAYHIAMRRGADIDQPRNLAKTVTVE